jgi:hypothetical protein
MVFVFTVRYDNLLYSTMFENATRFGLKQVKCVNNMLEFAGFPKFYNYRNFGVLGILFCVSFLLLNHAALFLMKNIISKYSN